MEIIIGRQGNQKTKITDPTVSRKHCKVTVNPDGTFTLENLSPSGTKVDGREVIHTTVKLNSSLQLGPTFSAILVELIGNPLAGKSSVAAPAGSPVSSSAPKPSSPQRSGNEPKTFNISHLERVWDDYNSTNIKMAEKQRHVNLTRTGMGIFTMCAMPLCFFLGPVAYILTGLGIIGNIYSFVGLKNAETPEERQQRQDEFDEAWVCPNPECGHSIMAKNYKLLLRNHQSCPYCKCKYVAK